MSKASLRQEYFNQFSNLFLIPNWYIYSIHNSSYLPICLTIDWYSRFSKDVGHYTAMVWSNTNKIGCGITEFREGKWFAKLYTCNYGPAGNYIGGQMYAKGRACTKCPSGTSCSVQYPGLCGKYTNDFFPSLTNLVFIFTCTALC